MWVKIFFMFNQYYFDAKRQIREYVDNNKNDPPLDMMYIITDILGWNITHEDMTDSSGYKYEISLHIGKTEFTKENPWTLILSPTLDIESLDARTNLGVLIGFFLEEYYELIQYDMVGFEYSQYPNFLHEYGKVSRGYKPETGDKILRYEFGEEFFGLYGDDELALITYGEMLGFCDDFFTPTKDAIDNKVKMLCKENNWDKVNNKEEIFNAVIDDWIGLYFDDENKVFYNRIFE